MGKKGRQPTTGVMDFLANALNKTNLLQLYVEETRGRFICRAVLQRLSPVAQQVVVRLSACGGTFPESGVQVWIAGSSGGGSSGNNTKTRFEQVMAELRKWAIVPAEQGSGDSTVVSLTPEFSKGLQETVLSPDCSPWKALSSDDLKNMEKEAKEAHKEVTYEDLERYTQMQWDAVLHFLVGTPKMKMQPSPAVIHFLLQTNLMQPDPEYTGLSVDDAPLVITEKGYDFMLQDNAQQVWHFVVQYLQSLESHKKHKQLAREALLLLVCLGFAQLGEAYLASGLSKDSRVMVKDLALFGLLYTRRIGKQTVFYPTRVAMELVGNQDEEGGGGGAAATSSMWSLSSKALNQALSNPKPQHSSHLSIIVQTNFQLCAYTTSELHVSMLGLFCEVQTIRRLPNVVFMTITRDSVKSAFYLGIQVRQILRFMEKHAHPKVREAMLLPGTSLSGTDSPVPGNVIDQIWLWDRERHRVKWTEVYSHQCMMPGEFQAVYKFTKDNKAHAWSSEAKNQLFISYAFAEKVQTYVRQWRANAASQQAGT